MSSLYPVGTVLCGNYVDGDVRFYKVRKETLCKLQVIRLKHKKSNLPSRITYPIKYKTTFTKRGQEICNHAGILNIHPFHSDLHNFLNTLHYDTFSVLPKDMVLNVCKKKFNSLIFFQKVTRPSSESNPRSARLECF